MARIFIDGFEDGTYNFWTVGSCQLPSGISGCSGTYCVKLWDPNSFINYTLSATETELWIRARIKIESMAANNAGLLHFRNGTTNVGSVLWNGSGYLKAMNNTTVLGTTTTPIGLDWFNLEVHYKLDGTSGIFEVKVDGILEIDFDGDTDPGTNATFDNIQFGRIATGIPDYWIDDIVIDDADWIGNSKIEGLVITGAGTTTQWDPSTGANYECVDEIPPSDTDYNSTNVTDEIDTFALGNLTSFISSIKCVQVQGKIAYEGAPTPTNIQLAIRSGGTDYFSSNIVPSSSFKHQHAIWELNPADSGAWEEADVNAMEIGIKAVA